MTKMIADTGLYYHGRTFKTGAEFKVNSEDATHVEVRGAGPGD